MSSLLTRVSSARESKTRRRSESVSALSRTKDSRRIPTIDLEDDKDVATLVSVEISRSIMLNPQLDLGVFLKTASNSRRDISISDATIIISVAILEHIGNKKMASELLKKSATLTKYYEKMGLKDKEIREMLVTMLFALSPQFVNMIETSIRLAIDRSASMGNAPHAEQQIANAFVSLAESGAITEHELATASTMGSEFIPGNSVLARKLSTQRTPTELIAPSESASVATMRPAKRRSITEKDLFTYISRRKSGPEPEFGSVFTRSAVPIKVDANVNKYGVGYKPIVKAKDWFSSGMNNVLGSASVKSYDIRTGNVTRRRPTVEDYLESESFSESVLNEPPDIASGVEEKWLTLKFNKPEPTESYLPDSVIDLDASTVREVSRVDSLEELRGRFRDLK